MKNILVTGWAGYIGSHTVRELNKQWYNSIIFDNLELWHQESIIWNEIFVGDLRNIQDLEAAFEKYTIDAVIHFAAYASVPDSVDHPDKYYINNLTWGLNLLNTMNKFGVKKIIFSSSASVYWEPESEIITESHPKNPTNPYWHSKLLFEQILHWYHVAYNISSISFRYFCASWASSDWSIWELHTPETHVIPCAILASLGKRDSFIVFGDDYPTPDGTGIRDFIHVEDLATAHVLWLSQLDNGICEQCNLGIWKWFSVKEIIGAVERVSGKKFPYVVAPRRKWDPSILIADNKKAIELLSWRPKYTSIDDIVRTAFIFLQSHHESH